MLRKLRMRMASEEKGFTLIELLVVILIIGILAAIALPAFLGQRQKGQDADAKTLSRTVATAEETHYTDEQTYTTTKTALEGIEPSLKGDADWGVTTGDANGYVVTGKSKSGATFTVTKAAGAVTRTCDKKGQGGCPSSGNW